MTTTPPPPPYSGSPSDGPASPYGSPTPAPTGPPGPLPVAEDRREPRTPGFGLGLAGMILAILSLFGLNFFSLSAGFSFGEPAGWYVDLALATPLIVGVVALVLGLLSIRSRSTTGRSFATTAIVVALVAIPVGGLSWYAQYEQRQAYCEEVSGSSIDEYGGFITPETEC